MWVRPVGTGTVGGWGSRLVLMPSLTPRRRRCDTRAVTSSCYGCLVPTLVDSATLRWLESAAARQHATNALGRRGLPPTLVDDVLQEARVRVWRTEGRLPEPVDNPAGFGHRMLQYAVADLTRTTRRRPPAATAPADDHAADPAPPVDVVVVAGAFEDACRRAVAEAMGEQPWRGAAVLTELTLRLHADVPVPVGAPAPVGASDDGAVAWAALWLAGRHDCFPVAPAGDDAATRRRRSRALAAVADHLRHVVRLVQGDLR